MGAAGSVRAGGVSVTAVTLTVTDVTVPRLPRGVRLKRDDASGTWVLLAPERILKLDDISYAILSRVDGEATFRAIVDDLAAVYDADPVQVESDTRQLLLQIAERRLLEL